MRDEIKTVVKDGHVFFKMRREKTYWRYCFNDILSLINAQIEHPILWMDLAERTGKSASYYSYANNPKVNRMLQMQTLIELWLAINDLANERGFKFDVELADLIQIYED